ncbi:MAG: glycosyltransferase family 2 protein [Phycisphaerae bacterium]|nr:glycosyltransferase family 2 protein [Phycisphaerae bacterium]
MPVYNESRLLGRVMERFDAVPPPHGLERRLVIVDDGSTDATPELVRALATRPDVVARLHERNMGKGAAVRTAWRAALEAGAEIVLIHDADLEYDPADHAGVLAPIVDGRADAVIGTRFLGATHRVLYYWHSVANRFITTASNMLTNLNLTDIECCTKALTRRAAERITIEEDRFGLEPELIAKLARLRLAGPDGADHPARVYEVPVSYAGRTYAEGKKITWRDGVSALRCIVKYGVR